MVPMKIIILAALVSCSPLGADSLADIFGLLKSCSYVTQEMVEYLSSRHSGGGMGKALMGLVSKKDFSEHHSIVYVHNSYITCDLMRDPQYICKTLYDISSRVNKTFVRDRFLIRPKADFNELITNAETLKNIQHVAHSAVGGDKRAIECLYQMFERRVADVGEYLDVLQALRRRGVPKASSLLGEMHMYGHGVGQDRKLAAKYFYEGVKRNEAASYNGLGYMLMSGDPENIELSRKYLARASTEGFPAANFNMFLLYRKIFGSDQIGLMYLLSSVDQGYLPAMYRYAEILYEQKRFSAAIPYFLSICEFSDAADVVQRDTEAAFLGGDYRKTLALLLLGAEMGSSTAIKNAIYLLKRQRSLVRDQGTVLFYLLSTYADMGIVTHLVELGDCYFYGIGVARSYTDAFSYYLSSSLYGSGKGLYALSYMHQNGLGCGRDPVAALRYVFSIFEESSSAYLVVLYMLPCYLLQDLVIYFPYKGTIIATAIFIAIMGLRITKGSL